MNHWSEERNRNLEPAFYYYNWQKEGKEDDVDSAATSKRASPRSDEV